MLHKSPGIPLVSNILLKYKHLIGNEIVPWTVACIKITFISYTLSPSPLLPHSLSLKSSCHNATCGDPGWHISARKAVQVFAPIFPSVFQSPIKYTSVRPEITPLLVQIHSTLPVLHLISHCQPFTVTANHSIFIAFYVVRYCTQRSTYFQPPPCEHSSKNELICSIPHLDDQVCRFAGEVDLWTHAWDSQEIKFLTSMSQCIGNQELV